MNGSGLHFSPWLAGYLLVFVFVGFGEEIAFRGYAMGTLRQTEKDWLMVLLPAVLFGIAHSTNANFSLMGCGNIILAGILLGLLALKSGQLWLESDFTSPGTFSRAACSVSALAVSARPVWR